MSSIEYRNHVASSLQLNVSQSYANESTINFVVSEQNDSRKKTLDKSLVIETLQIFNFFM